MNKKTDTPAHLFSELEIRDVTFRNRIGVSPMCQYSSIDGFASDWHLVHLGSRAVGGAGVVFTEASAVLPEGRISPDDLGIWSDDHIENPPAHFLVHRGSMGRVPGHAARARGAHGGRPVRRGKATRRWQNPARRRLVAHLRAEPGPVRQGLPDAGTTRYEWNRAHHRRLLRSGQARTGCRGEGRGNPRRARLSARSNFFPRSGTAAPTNTACTFENRIRLLCEVCHAVRHVWPERYPLFVRISASDWVGEGGPWRIRVALGGCRLKVQGVDLIDCSSGGMTPDAKIPAGPGYQVPFAERVRREGGICTAAVGMITSPEQADQIIRTGQADMVFMAREFLRDPYWPLHAAKQLRHEFKAPVQYGRAF